MFVGINPFTPKELYRQPVFKFILKIEKVIQRF